MTLIERLMNTVVFNAEGGAGGPPPGDPWHKGLPAEHIGHLQNRGLDTKTPAEVAAAMTAAHWEAQKMIGVPADQLLKLPKEATDEAGWKAVRERLGGVHDPKGFDFTAVKTAKGEAPAQAVLDTIAAVAAKHGFTKAAAADVAAEVVKQTDGFDAARETERQGKITVEKAELVKNWGNNFEANKFIATQGAKKLGVAPETVAALEGQIGYKAVMEMFLKLGQLTGEDKFVANGNTSQPGVMTKEQAIAKKAELMNDTAWGKRYLEGGQQSPEFKQMQALQVIING